MRPALSSTCRRYEALKMMKQSTFFYPFINTPRPLYPSDLQKHNLLYLFALRLIESYPFIGYLYADQRKG
ncbi:MAG: hypothetical protein A3C35_08680 [Omnitrophica bacterium RIFCSPHIGHO2_02_FULL_46_11]|nr:MAG: hypothetical protein A3C35_08680 [Omnitrophica bacterium RIFCSPHIGHO2_02_FULL_46_11]